VQPRVCWLQWNRVFLVFHVFFFPTGFFVIVLIFCVLVSVWWVRRYKCFYYYILLCFHYGRVCSWLVDSLTLFLGSCVIYRERACMGLVLLVTRFSLFGMWWYGAAICSVVVEVFLLCYVMVIYCLTNGTVEAKEHFVHLFVLFMCTKIWYFSMLLICLPFLATCIIPIVSCMFPCASPVFNMCFA
jgi:hypothetical protein